MLKQSINSGNQSLSNNIHTVLCTTGKYKLSKCYPITFKQPHLNVQGFFLKGLTNGYLDLSLFYLTHNSNYSTTSISLINSEFDVGCLATI